MKRKLFVIGLFCVGFLYGGTASEIIAGPNSNAEIRVLLTEGAAESTAFTGSSELTDVDQSTEVWAKIYAYGVDSLQLYQIFVRYDTTDLHLAVDPVNLDYIGTSVWLETSNAGESSILVQNDTVTTGPSTNFSAGGDSTLTGTAKIELGGFIYSGQTSQPGLSNDSGFVAEIKFESRSYVGTLDSSDVQVTFAVFQSEGGVKDTLTNLDSAPVTFVPVELAAFSGIIGEDNRITLTWTTLSETNNLGFAIERSTDGETWEEVDFISGAGTTDEEQIYTFIDGETTIAGKYYYRLRQVDFNGAVEYTEAIEVVVGAPAEYSLSNNYPNPFNPATSINFQLPEEGFVTLEIYNVLGQVVRSMVNTEMPAGYHQVIFNARDLASGVYIYRLQVNNFSASKKMLLMK